MNVPRVRQLFLASGYRTDFLATKCGVSDRYMRDIIAGRITPSLAVVKLLAIAFNVPEAEILISEAS